VSFAVPVWLALSLIAVLTVVLGWTRGALEQSRMVVVEEGAEEQRRAAACWWPATASLRVRVRFLSRCARGCSTSFPLLTRARSLSRSCGLAQAAQPARRRRCSGASGGVAGVRASNRRSSVIVSRQLLASDCGCPTVRRRLMRFGVGDEHAGADGFVVLRVSTCADAGVLGARGVDKADVRVLPSRAPVHRRLLAFQLPEPRRTELPQGPKEILRNAGPCPMSKYTQLFFLRFPDYPARG